MTSPRVQVGHVYVSWMHECEAVLDKGYLTEDFGVAEK